MVATVSSASPQVHGVWKEYWCKNSICIDKMIPFQRKNVLIQVSFLVLSIGSIKRFLEYVKSGLSRERLGPCLLWLLKCLRHARSMFEETCMGLRETRGYYHLILTWVSLQQSRTIRYFFIPRISAIVVFCCADDHQLDRLFNIKDGAPNRQLPLDWAVDLSSSTVS